MRPSRTRANASERLHWLATVEREFLMGLIPGKRFDTTKQESRDPDYSGDNITVEREGPNPKVPLTW
jgi:hypothetical protein